MKQFQFLFGLLCSVLVIAVALSDTSSIDNDLYQIEYSIDDPAEFTQIGVINLRQLKQTQNAAHYQSIEGVEGGIGEAKLTTEHLMTHIETAKLDKVQIDKIHAALARADHNPLYRLRLCKKGLINQPAKCHAYTFTYLR